MRKLFLTLPLISVLLMPGAASAVENVQDVAGKAMPLMQSGGTARVLAMGSAYVALSQGASSLMLNPAGLGGLGAAELALHHNSSLTGIQETVVFGMPWGNLGGFGASFSYVDNGSFEGRDSSGELAGNYSAGDIGGSLAWGREWMKGLDLGLNIKANNQTLATQSYFAAAVDLGLLWSTPVPGLKAGLSYTNLGTSVASSALNSGVHLGASYGLELNPNNQLLAAVSGEVQPGGVNRAQVGAEDTLYKNYFLRAGYQLSLPDNEIDGLSGLTAGLGVVWSNFALDYAYLPFGDLGTSHRLSLAYTFGNSGI